MFKHEGLEEDEGQPRQVEGVSHLCGSFWFGHALPLLLFTLLAIVLTWPLALHLRNAYPGAQGEGAQDLWQNVWNLWWAREAIGRGTTPFFTDALFYPQGASLLFHPLNLTSGLLAIPLQVLFDLVTTYNTLALLSFALSGYFLYLLARAQGCSIPAALVGGLVYSSATYHFFHLGLGHLEQITRQWLPLYALALGAILTTTNHQPTIGHEGERIKETRRSPSSLRTARFSFAIPGSRLLGRRWLFILLATLALLAIIFTSLYVALYAALLTAVWALWQVVGALRQGEARALAGPFARLLVMTLLTFAVVGPVLLLPMAQEARQATYMLRTLDDATLGSARMADSLLPPPYHPLRALVALPAPYNPGAFLGYTALALAVVGVLVRRRVAVFWAILALLAWLLSLGPDLPLYRWLYVLPPMQIARYPDRFVALVTLGLAVLAAMGVDALRGKSQEPGARSQEVGANRVFAQEPGARSREGFLPVTFDLLPWYAVVVLLAGLILLEQHPRGVPLTPPIDNPFYRRLVAEPGQFSVLELPINRLNNMWVDMAAQTVHGKPILYGGLARPVPRPPLESLPLFRELEYPDAPADIVMQPVEQRAAVLRYFNLRYLTYHRTNENGPVTPPPAEALAHVVGVPITQVYADNELVGYRVDLPDGPASIGPIVSPGNGWYNLEPAGAAAQRWLRGGSGELLIWAPREMTATLRLKLAAFERPRRVELYAGSAQIGMLTAQTGPTEVQLAVPLHAGEQTLRLVAPEPGVSPESLGQGADPRVLTVSVLEVEMGMGDG